MKTFLVDFGPNSHGGRFALVQNETMERAFWDADEISRPFKIAELIIPSCDGIRYVEIDEPKTLFAGKKLSIICKWVDNPFEKAIEAYKRGEA